MMASRGMGDIAPSKMPKGKKKARRDDTDFTQYKEGGKVKSKVNSAGNYTKPELRKRIFNSVKAAAIVGTGAGQWSARKAQVMAKRYKAAGGGYRD
jgi:putative N-acetylmannosamine-6-phosphate epimerase